MLLALGLSAPARAAALRTLVYRYSIDAQNFGTSFSQGGYGNLSESTSGGTGGSTGEITVKVRAATQDGGLVVDAQEMVDRAERPKQPIRCAVYGHPDQVICDQHRSATAEEAAVLSYLGRFFYDPSRLDESGRWVVKQKLNQGTGSLISRFRASPADDGLVDIKVKRVLKLGAYLSTTTGTMLYNPKMEVPVSAKLRTDVEDGGNAGGSTVDFHLISDSFAQHP
jgi:hypothetical protein